MCTQVYILIYIYIKYEFAEIICIHAHDRIYICVYVYIYIYIDGETDIYKFDNNDKYMHLNEKIEQISTENRLVFCKNDEKIDIIWKNNHSIYVYMYICICM